MEEKALIPVKRESMFFDIARFEQAQRVAKMFTQSDLVPSHFRGNMANCVIALNYAERIGADPFMVLQNICVIHGKPGVEGKLVIALINNCGRFEPVQFEEIGNLDKPDKDADGCIAYAKDIKSGIELKGPKVSWGMVKAEGWYSKNGSKWKTIAQLMFRYRAATFFARTYCPEVLLGMQTREELMDVVELKQVAGGTYEPEPELKTQAELVTEFESWIGGDDMELCNQFLKGVASAQDMSVDEVKAQIVREDDFGNFSTHFKKWRKEQNGSSNGESATDNRVDGARVETDPDKPEWNPATAPLQKAYHQKKQAILLIVADENGLETTGKPADIHQRIIDHFAGNNGGSGDEVSNDDLERFNDIFTQERGTPAFHYAMGEVTGDEKNTFRPKTEQIPDWLKAFDAFQADMAG